MSPPDHDGPGYPGTFHEPRGRARDSPASAGGVAAAQPVCNQGMIAASSKGEDAQTYVVTGCPVTS